ncbi:phage integrase SAM-like domain-containing protein, partial [Acinetobacter baumannii]
SLKFSELNEKFCNDFKDFLLTSPSNRSSKKALSQNSAVSYFNKLKASLKQAYKDGYLQIDLNQRIEPIKQAETQRNFLTIEELNKLVKTDCT